MKTLRNNTTVLFIGAVVLVLPIEIEQRYYTKIKKQNNIIL
jgi:hypothetical protein